MKEIKKASAGSGKTFTLAKTYIEILLDKYVNNKKDREGYQHILAVTFTNKATAEMKDRIITELYILATHPEKSDFIEDFKVKYGSIKGIQTACSEILKTLLHDYSRFSVSTIDTFFQVVLRSFARELGQFNAYRIELDREGVVNETVDAILEELTDEKDAIVKVLTDMVARQLDEGRKADPVSALRGYALSIKEGAFLRALEVAGLNYEEAFSSQNISDLNNALKKRKGTLAEDLKAAALNLKNKCETEFGSGYDANFTSSFRNTLETLISGSKSGVGAGIFASNGAKCFDGRKVKDKASEATKIAAELEALRVLCLEITTLKIIEDSLPKLSLAAKVISKFDEVTKGKNIMCLDESTQLLNDLIDGSEAPFIYEKIGVRYDSFLLDEFQDTSNIQWNNFQPLLDESMATGGNILVVGDTKQSIYRFRDTDWSILENKVPLALDVEPRSLGSNFRSGKNIVEFNNDLFKWLPKRLDDKIAAQTGESEGELLQSIYDEDVAQEVMKGFDGIVDVKRVQEDEMIGKTVALIKDLHTKGVPYCRILVLLRKREQCTAIAEALVADDIAVYSEESLRIESDPLALLLSSVLRYIDNPSDSVSHQIIEQNGIEIPASYNSLVDLCEQIILSIKSRYSGEEFAKSIPYLDAFVDIVKNFELNNGNSLHTMLAAYDRSKKLIASAPSREAVQMMTIHKSKGLAGYFVIVPFLEKIGLFKEGEKWAELDKNHTLPKEFGKAIYTPYVSSKSLETYFSEKYKDEYRQSIVDNANLLYVALTRAQYGLYLLAKAKEKENSMSSMADFVIAYLKDRGLLREDGYSIGSIDETIEKALAQDVKDQEKDKAKSGEHLALGYPVSSSRGKMRQSNEAGDFFSRGNSYAFEKGKEHRQRGIVLHDILSRITVKEDLEKAVSLEAAKGTLDNPEDTFAFLSEALDSVAAMGWFDSSVKVIKERGIITSDGKSYRPDRIVLFPDGRIDVVDYKFGAEHDEQYTLQVRNYCELLKGMGYSNVKGYLWYVGENKYICKF